MRHFRSGSVRRIDRPTLGPIIASRITARAKRADGRKGTPQRVAVRLRDDAEHEIALSEVLGSPGRPLSRERHLAKFRACWRAAPDLPPENGERLVTMVDGLEGVADVAEILSALTLR